MNEKIKEPVKGSWAIVTGASSGIGLELAKVFSKNGFKLLIAADGPEIPKAADELRAMGTEVEWLQVDLRKYDDVETLYRKIEQLPGEVDSVALNAGVGLGGDFEGTDLKKELDIIELNVASVVHLAKRMIQFFRKQGYGRMLFTSSIAGESPGPYLSVYSASKAFVQSFAEAIRYELKDSGIVVTALQPGATETNFFARAEMLDTKVGTAEKDDPADVARQGFDALMAGKDHVVAGSFKNKVQAGLSKMVSQKSAAAGEAREAKPGSALH